MRAYEIIDLILKAILILVAMLNKYTVDRYANIEKAKLMDYINVTREYIKFLKDKT